MKQYHINSQNYSSDNDCLLPPDDPLHDMIAAQYMGGLNAAHRMNERKAEIAKETAAIKEPLLQYARDTGIKPGTPAWYALMGNAPAHRNSRKKT